MTVKVTITLDPMLAATLRSVLRKRLAELDRHMAAHGEALPHVEHLLHRDVRANVAACLALVDAALPEKAVAQ